jgi:hypothetical protein
MSQLILRPPQDDDELHEAILTLCGFDIPREKVCRNHVAPFDAFSDAFFSRHPVSIWKASRGFGGKSTLLGTLVWAEAVLLSAQVTVLGGSAAQSQRVHEVTQEVWYSPLAPTGLLESDPTTFKTRLKNRAWIIALMASQKSVRGPHPQRLRLDEIDEMDLDILEAAQGQPQEARGIESQTVMSSTHQYPDGTMTTMMNRAGEKGWPIYEWCWRESMGTADNPGWLKESMVLRKQAEVSKQMWDTEYDLQEPSFEGRAIVTEFVDLCFDPALGEYDGEPEYEVIAEEPVEGVPYVTGVDWAKENDWTVIRTFRADGPVWQEVAFMRIQRKTWSYMVHLVNRRWNKYGGIVVHDSTGLGSVVNDLLEIPRTQVKPFVLVGRERESAFIEYIAAIEHESIKCPRITFAYNEHKYVRSSDLFTSSGHAPDSFVAGALAWSVRRRAVLDPVRIHSALKDGGSQWQIA